jgi:predicted transcriptional regulator
MQGTLTVRLSTRLKADLYKLSQSEHIPVSDLVRESVRRYVAVRRFRKLRSRVVPYAQAQGLLTDDDIFNALS